MTELDLGSMHEKGVSSDSEQGETPDGQEPTEKERKTLRRVGESLPKSAFLVAIIELSERFTYYGCSGIFQVSYIVMRHEVQDANMVSRITSLDLSMAPKDEVHWAWAIKVPPV